MQDYLDWESPLSLEQVFASGETFSHPVYTPLNDCLYLGVIKHEKSRSALMLRNDSGTHCLTPSSYSLQTKVNEYGGKPYWLFGNVVVFANQRDQCLYQQRLEADGATEPQRLTPTPTESQRYMYTDVQQVGDGHFIAIVELEDSTSDAENKMFIGLISRDRDAAPVALSAGADFYSNLVVCPTGKRVAWVQWHHPAMPWDATQLWTAELATQHHVKFSNARQVRVAEKSSFEPSICQLLFANNGRLFFSADYKNASGLDDFWNLHVLNFDSNEIKKIAANPDQLFATQELEERPEQGLEFGYPHWVYGDARLVQLDDHRLLTVGSLPRGDQLFVIDQDSYQISPVGNSDATLQHLATNQAGRCLLTSLAKDAPPSLLELNVNTDSRLLSSPKIVIKADAINFDISQAEHTTFATRDGEQAYGFYYAPRNDECQLQTRDGAKPPLIVMVHGGPTARAYGHFDLQKQFWTSRGFAILDVNHRGSSGYGRRYRDALYGQWGEIDASDIIDGIEHLIAQGKVDARRVCIRGKSAGGYAVLRALTEYPEVFKAGACYYGIGNLVTLAEVTHKFEKHYTDHLVDEVFDRRLASLPNSKFFQRSPINKIDQIGSAMIVFQGALDKVVPPAVAQEVVSALKAANLNYEYVEYADEAHGFRQIHNSIDAMQKELAFYRRILAD